ncbi:hypothetical protein [Streptococcus agalactiae]
MEEDTKRRKGQVIEHKSLGGKDKCSLQCKQKIYGGWVETIYS